MDDGSSLGSAGSCEIAGNGGAPPRGEEGENGEAKRLGVKSDSNVEPSGVDLQTNTSEEERRAAQRAALDSLESMDG